MAFVVIMIGASSIISLLHSASPSTVNPRSTSGNTATARPSVDNIIGLLPGSDGAPDLLLSFDGDQHKLALFDGRTHAQRWQGGTFGKSVDPDATAFDAERIYVADQSRLSAIGRADGQVAWQASLVADLASTCHGCLMARKQRIIALQKDGSLQAFDVATGQQVWSIRLLGTPSHVSEAGGLLAVMQPIATGSNAAMLELIDPNDGSVVRTLKPSCADNTVRHLRQTERAGTWSTTLFSQDGGRTVFFFFGSSVHCGQAWDVTTGETLWSTLVPKWYPTNRYVVGDRRILYKIDDHSIASIDIAHGTLTKLIADSGQKLTPVDASGDTALVSAAPNWNSDRVSLLSLNAVTGAPRWQFALSCPDAGSAMRDDFRSHWGTWWVTRASGGLAVVQVLDEHQLSIDLLNPETGTSAGRKILPTDAKPFNVVLGDRMVWVQVRGRVDAVKLSDATVAYQLP